MQRRLERLAKVSIVLAIVNVGVLGIGLCDILVHCLTEAEEETEDDVQA